MKHFILLILILIPTTSFAETLREGVCLKSAAMPSIIIKIHKIGDTSVSIKSNVSGSLLTQYNKHQLEEEIKVGTTDFTSCSDFKEINDDRSGKSAVSSDLFGVKLDETFETFKRVHATEILSCKDETDRTDSNSDSSFVKKRCLAKDGLEIIFGEGYTPGIFLISEIKKSFAEKNITNGAIVKKLESKTGGPIKKILRCSGMSNSEVYDFSDGRLALSFQNDTCPDDSSGVVTKVRWWSATLGELRDKRLLEEKQKKAKELDKKNELKAKDLNI